MRKRSIFILFFAFIVVFGGVGKLLIHSNSPGGDTFMSERLVVSKKPRLPMLYEETNSWEIPAVIALNDEQREYVIEVLSALVRVIEGVSSLEQEEQRVLGVGQFYWPKDPDEPVRLSKSYFGENFRMSGIAVKLSRENESSPWNKVGVTIHPRNFPKGVFSMRLPSSFFREFELLSVAQEKRQNQRIDEPIVFYFKHKKMEYIELRVEARADVVTARDPFPSSMHFLEILRRP